MGQQSQPLFFYQRDSGGATMAHEFQDGVLPDVNYASTRDVEIRQDQPDTNFGGAVSITIDGDDPSSSSQDTAALLRWDVSDLSAGSAVQSATITFEAFDPTNNSYTHLRNAAGLGGRRDDVEPVCGGAKLADFRGCRCPRPWLDFIGNTVEHRYWRRECKLEC